MNSPDILALFHLQLNCNKYHLIHIIFHYLELRLCHDIIHFQFFVTVFIHITFLMILFTYFGNIISIMGINAIWMYKNVVLK